MKHDGQLKNKMLDYWNSQNFKHERKTLIKATAEKFDIPEELVVQHIGEWESGKGNL